MPTLRPPIVYLVDDDEVESIALQRSCKAASLKTETFDRPAALLTRFEDENLVQLHGCIVSDLWMPRMTGTELLTILQQRSCPLPFILLTGVSDVPTCRDALKSGAFDYVEKDFSTKTLMKAIAAAISLDAKRLDRLRHTDRINQKLALLTPKEREVADLIAEGADLNDIAMRLDITPQTASKHRSRIYEKLDVDNEVALAHFMGKTE